MQNKANFKKAEMNVSYYLQKDYENKCIRRPMGKQTQTKPISLPTKWGKLCTRHAWWPIK
jgi:hypothetical protein